MSHLLMVPPSIRMNVNFRAVAALVAIQRGSHILTLTSLSLCAMRLVRAVITVLVSCLLTQEHQNNVVGYKDLICHSGEIKFMHSGNIWVCLQDKIIDNC